MDNKSSITSTQLLISLAIFIISSALFSILLITQNMTYTFVLLNIAITLLLLMFILERFKKSSAWLWITLGLVMIAFITAGLVIDNNKYNQPTSTIRNVFTGLLTSYLLFSLLYPTLRRYTVQYDYQFNIQKDE